MLSDQSYDGHASLHDDATAAALGFQAGAIEGPTHFSQFTPALEQLWGRAWFERGCFSAHFQNMVVEGERVRTFVERQDGQPSRVRAWAEKEDGTPVLEASASLEPSSVPTLLEQRLGQLREPDGLVILQDLRTGMTGHTDERVQMAANQDMGALYPFTLMQKLALITEPPPWYSDDAASPWGRAIIPLEMVSVLSQYTSASARFPVRGPAVGLFADLEIRLIEGPLFVGEPYLIRREIVALSESRRTESFWVRTRIFDANGKRQVAETLLNHALLTHSYARYETERAALAAAGQQQ